MIVTVTCNPAVDVTYRVDRLEPGTVHRVADVATRPGGKGVNVARVLHQLGEPVTATGLADPFFGATVEALGVPAAFVAALPAVRRTLVIDSGAGSPDRTTSLWEPGTAPADPTAAAVLLVEQLTTLLTDADALVVSGSLPPGVDPALPAGLASVATAAGIPAVLDLDNAALTAAADGGGAVLVPNRDELSRVSGADLDPLTAAWRLSGRTGAPVVATLGAEGMLACTADGCWEASIDASVEGNPTGAGDAAAAAIARGLVRGAAWPETLADAVALSAAAVVAPVAGEVDLETYRRLHPGVAVAPIEPPEA